MATGEEEEEKLNVDITEDSGAFHLEATASSGNVSIYIAFWVHRADFSDDDTPDSNFCIRWKKAFPGNDCYGVRFHFGRSCDTLHYSAVDLGGFGGARKGHLIAQWSAPVTDPLAAAILKALEKARHYYRTGDRSLLNAHNHNHNHN
jgi:hypothetical protein